MSNTTTDQSAISIATEHVPCVRYGFPTNSDKPRQAPKLRSIYQEIPEIAETASPIYFLPSEEYKRQREKENGWEVKGEKCIATALQNDCEDCDRVLYPVYIESDSYPEEGLETLVGWYQRFLQDYLKVDPETCTYYFSGNRSIHVHVPRVVSAGSDLTTLKNQAETFCEKTGAKLDCGIYSRKRQFRLPGVIHQKTGSRKIRIEPDWDRKQMANAVAYRQPPKPETFADVLETTFEPLISPDMSKTAGKRAKRDSLTEIGDEQSVLSFSRGSESKVATPLIEQQAFAGAKEDLQLWRAYNAKEFSPYANAGTGNDRSVASIRVLGGAFARKGVRNGTTLIPSHFYGAHGCLGREFTMYDTHAPLQLSDSDWKKWEFEMGDTVVIIGGKSNESRLIEIDTATALSVGHLLHPEKGSRQEALAYLEREGYETGSSGQASAKESNPARTPADYEQVLPVDDPSVSEPARLQQQAEREGIQTLDHGEKRQVAFRLLTKYNWEPVWEWFRKQFGDDFKPDVTRRQLRSVVEAYPNQRTHVEVPSRS